MAEAKYEPRLKAEYLSRIRGVMQEQFSYSNVMMIPRLDKVVVLTGKDKGRTGEVIQVMPKEDRAFVRGINMIKRHQRQTQTQEAGIINKEASIHLSNLAVADTDGKATRVGFSVVDGKKVRVAKRSGDVING